MRSHAQTLRTIQLRQFGRKGMAAVVATPPRSTIVEDIKLFALTFAGGFLFVSLYLA